MLVVAIAVIICLTCSAFCSVTEAAFYSIPKATVESLVQQEKFTGKYIQHVKNNIERYIASVLILNTVANTLGVYLATALAVTRLNHFAQIILPFALTVLILLFGEITPKTIGVKQAKSVAPVSAFIMYYVTKLLQWTGLVWLCLAITRHWTKSGRDKVPDVSVEDINSLVNLGLREEVLDRQQAAIIKNILSIKSVPVRKVMTPRQVVFTLSADMTIGEALDEHGNWPYSRIPVYRDDKEKWEGLVLRRDAYNHIAAGRRDLPISKLMRPIQFVPDSLMLDKLLLRFLKQRGHVVAVVDEWGSIAGIASLEDVLEEILGHEIVDEFDENVDLQKHTHRKSKALGFLKAHERESRQNQ